LSDFSQLLKDLEKSAYDITGITDNAQLQYHIQSYLMHFNRNALENLNIQNFLKSIVHLGLKNDVILKYELGLTRTAQLSGLFVGALFPWNLVVSPGKNPSLTGWNRLFDLGFPFLKREAVRLGNHFEVKSMIREIEQKYPNSNWAVAELKSIS
jgi:lipopolysaccharide biosynthesis protein